MMRTNKMFRLAVTMMRNYTSSSNKNIITRDNAPVSCGERGVRLRSWDLKTRLSIKHEIVMEDYGTLYAEESEEYFDAQVALCDKHTFNDGLQVNVRTFGAGSGFKIALDLMSGGGDTTGIDLVAMNFNHLVTCGARPVVYENLLEWSSGEHSRKVLRGMALACQQSGYNCYIEDREKVKLSHDEFIAEMNTPPVKIRSSVGHGIVDGPFVDGKNIEVGDVIIGLPSNGLHSHGFSLVIRALMRKILSSVCDNLPGTNTPIYESLITPTSVYVKQVLDIVSEGGVNGIAYIAKGGLTENLTTLFQKSGRRAVLFTDSWPVPPVFKWIQEAGRIKDEEMRGNCNMGIGMVLVMSQERAVSVLEKSSSSGNQVYPIGEVVKGDGITYH